MNTIKTEPEIRVLKTPLADGFSQQMQEVLTALVENTSILLNTLTPDQLEKTVKYLKLSPFLNRDGVFLEDQVVCIAELVRFKYGWRIGIVDYPHMINGYDAYLNDLPFSTVLIILKALEQFV